MAATNSQSTVQMLNMLSDQQLDDFVKLLSPQARQAVEALGQGASRVDDAAVDEIAQAVWRCLDR